jgi:quercetin dioxygenase-like cupin family protein
MTLQVTRFRWDEVPLDKVTEMVARKVLSGDDFSLSQTYFKKGAKMPQHAHGGERLVYVLQGAVRVVTQADDTTVREGELLVIPAGLSHQAEVLDDAFVLTVARTDPDRRPA